MRLYITATQISDCDYPVSKMCCQIMSGIFGKGFYLILHKMPSKRYGKFRAYHAYIRLIDYQKVISLFLFRLPSLEKEKPVPLFE